MTKDTFIDFPRATEITITYPTPFHIYDEKGIRENVRQLKTAFSWNKGYKEYFAVKANPNPYLLEILKEEGCGADCSSFTELEISNAVGFRGDEIMFSSNETPKEDFELALKLNATINLDDFTHIEYLEKIQTLPETISCRYNSGKFSYGNDIMSEPSEAKYGFTFDQLVEGFNLMSKKGVKEFGIHAFLASNTEDNDYYPTLAKTLFEVAVKLKELTGVKIKFLNLSGGIGIPYMPDETKRDIMYIGSKIKEYYTEILVPAGMGDLAIFNELGRYVLGPYGALISTAIHKKNTYKRYIGLDACSVDLMRPAMYGAYHHITVLNKEDLALTETYDVVGGLCENSDKFAINRMLPNIQDGDLLYIHDTGAHGHAMGYNYNGKLKSAELLLQEDGSVKLIRRAERPKDYYATLDYPGL